MCAKVVDDCINQCIKDILGNDDFTIHEINGNIKKKLLGEVLSKSTMFNIYRKDKFITVRCVGGNDHHRYSSLIIPNGCNQYEYIKEYQRTMYSHGTLYIEYYKTGNGWVALSTHKSEKFLKHSMPLVDVWGKKIMRMKKINKAGGNININLLLHGIPGSGKSRFAALIAAKSDMVLRIVNIKDKESLHSDSTCIYLIEEIDKLLMPNGDFVSDSELNVDTVLQFLDGALRPRNSVIVITCNDLARVESNEVLSRKGRITSKIEFDYICEHQCKSVCDIYYDGHDYLQLWNKIKSCNVTIAELSTYIGNCIIDDIGFDDMVVGFEVVDKKKKKKQASSMYY